MITFQLLQQASAAGNIGSLNNMLGSNAPSSEYYYQFHVDVFNIVCFPNDKPGLGML